LVTLFILNWAFEGVPVRVTLPVTLGADNQDGDRVKLSSLCATETVKEADLVESALLVAVIFADPPATPLTSPLLLTVATLVLLLDQVTLWLALLGWTEACA
jgi:hypothetical protein